CHRVLVGSGLLYYSIAGVKVPGGFCGAIFVVRFSSVQIRTDERILIGYKCGAQYRPYSESIMNYNRFTIIYTPRNFLNHEYFASSSNHDRNHCRSIIDPNNHYQNRQDSVTLNFDYSKSIVHFLLIFCLLSNSLAKPAVVRSKLNRLRRNINTNNDSKTVYENDDHKFNDRIYFNSTNNNDQNSKFELEIKTKNQEKLIKATEKLQEFQHQLNRQVLEEVDDEGSLESSPLFLDQRDEMTVGQVAVSAIVHQKAANLRKRLNYNNHGQHRQHRFRHKNHKKHHSSTTTTVDSPVGKSNYNEDQKIDRTYVQHSTTSQIVPYV
uniref:Uncharacterized protein n=1 Tax=Romanomermis culicivorax TaxID=13658 RepID=A0A915HFC6_ROMCU